ncbi:ADP-ribosylglycohydrolase family protein, partial [Micromonospora sp. NPDC049799]|uniref:ADP-ribosylglycohydrolase family protein n=1 Tax=Micromonospora sp. NPDC049799 TaxID=3154741 RepID=UPI0033F54B20
MSFTLFADSRLALARDALAGLSVGDALGSQFFVPGVRPADLAAGRLPPPPWQWTDDTEMACSVVAALAEAGRIDRDALALAFASRCEPYRGYGPGAVRILRLIRTGTPWPVAAASAFDGQGSCGNGAAMSVGPLGAYFADSTSRGGRPGRAGAGGAPPPPALLGGGGR